MHLVALSVAITVALTFGPTSISTLPLPGSRFINPSSKFYNQPKAYKRDGSGVVPASFTGEKQINVLDVDGVSYKVNYDDIRGLNDLREQKMSRLSHNVSFINSKNFGGPDEPVDEISVTLLGKNPKAVYQRDLENPQGIFYKK
ncbi:expressed protein [Batrachochytrium dendrobatidis JAM81]|uniref:Expressed protein n=2 Tax=Batrachochytrium dendrobatidis TaxID=109871 RepID=F4P723_BATDJ|nr:uncharacterized protein BATDEDRAFT_35487 [Batrachochytrium dendrobatidis JAM81]EGF78974.1 expressed protein [Batrachochytrium dendrobatidis JAM81]KAJ8325456.1 hypothetical protein O5D80_006394 [Batrachochytrium dendrobatidis]KAK5670271.1 hypothetical protein QVD99_003287 [Batrachochytrium dendrobatidis]OAJ42476.1 hypothetical protein BDEG_25926 [Batrachochytrium dendrobatidis JEL423]|eukprot:XP_006680393.1 expressed protein [Batrachochytrium dendrobatidis JAM81]